MRLCCEYFLTFTTLHFLSHAVFFLHDVSQGTCWSQTQTKGQISTRCPSLLLKWLRGPVPSRMWRSVSLSTSVHCNWKCLAFSSEIDFQVVSMVSAMCCLPDQPVITLCEEDLTYFISFKQWKMLVDDSLHSSQLQQLWKFSLSGCFW